MVRPHDALARKYCFRASVKIVNSAKAPVGVFFGYDTKPSIAKEVEVVGEEFCRELEEARYACDNVELIMHEECPVELTNEIFFQPFEALSPNRFEDASRSASYDSSPKQDAPPDSAP